MIYLDLKVYKHSGTYIYLWLIHRLNFSISVQEDQTCGATISNWLQTKN
jgi:hypothetical protein